MNFFHLHRKTLYCEDVSLARIACEVGTPTYVYSTAALSAGVKAFRSAFAALRTHICYSVKANPALAILKLLADLGTGFDIVSAGELHRVLQARGNPRKVVFSGVGKREDELAFALRMDIAQFNVESAEELQLLSRVAQRLRKPAPFALRVNPDVDAKTHAHMTTGLKTSKFGVPLDTALALYRSSRRLKGLKPCGLDCHIGSQLTDVRPIRKAVMKMASLFRALNAEGFRLEYLDIGGGLGVQYTTETTVDVADYARVVQEILRGLDVTLVLEPGRRLVANAGVLLTRVLYRKQPFLVVDTGMNDLLRPALYATQHDIRPLKPHRGPKRPADVVGSVCESSDVFSTHCRLPPVKTGDFLAVMTAGAYGMSMASTYNSRPRAAEVLVNGGHYRVIRARETVENLWHGETL